MKIKKNCFVCNKVFYPKPSTIKKEWGKFCSRHCYTIWGKGKCLNTGRTHFKKGFTPWNKGKSWSEEIKQKISKSERGKFIPLETRIKMSKSRKGMPNPMSEETRKKLSKALRGKWIREKSPQWKGGLTPICESLRKSILYEEWRQQIYIRDNFTCQKCGQKGGRLEAHHIEPFSKLWQEARDLMPLLPAYDAAILYTPIWDINNGMTLCEICHSKTKSYGRSIAKCEDEWIKKLKQKEAEK